MSDVRNLMGPLICQSVVMHPHWKVPACLLLHVWNDYDCRCEGVVVDSSQLTLLTLRYMDSAVYAATTLHLYSGTVTRAKASLHLDRCLHPDRQDIGMNHM